MKKIPIAYKFAVALALAAALFPFYVELAVGVIDPPGGPIIWMELGVLVVGIIGAIIARFRPSGMARALFATALAQTLVAVIALIVLPAHPASPPIEILGVNGLFVALFVGSALLFQYAAREHNGSGAEPTA
ncbi:MAG TPA: hypothetical protein VF181_01285 [Balneolaceae bacterium]